MTQRGRKPAKAAAAAPPKRARKLAPSEHAIALFRFLEKEWDVMQIAMTTWCRENDIPDPTVARWGKGIEPDVRNLRRVAEALNRPLLDILIAAKYVTPDEAGGYQVKPREYDAREAIRLDPKLDKVAREALLQMLDAITLVQQGGASRVRSTSSRSRPARSRAQA